MLLPEAGRHLAPHHIVAHALAVARVARGVHPRRVGVQQVLLQGIKGHPRGLVAHVPEVAQIEDPRRNRVVQGVRARGTHAQQLLEAGHVRAVHLAVRRQQVQQRVRAVGVDDLVRGGLALLREVVQDVHVHV